MLDNVPLLGNVSPLLNYITEFKLNSVNSLDLKGVVRHYQFRMPEDRTVNGSSLLRCGNLDNLKIMISCVVFCLFNVIGSFIDQVFNIIHSLSVYIKNMTSCSDSITDRGNDSGITVKPYSKGKSGMNKSNPVNSGSVGNGADDKPQKKPRGGEPLKDHYAEDEYDFFNEDEHYSNSDSTEKKYIEPIKDEIRKAKGRIRKKNRVKDTIKREIKNAKGREYYKINSKNPAWKVRKKENQATYVKKRSETETNIERDARLAYHREYNNQYVLTPQQR